MDLQMYPDIGLNCILLLTIFCVFNLDILSLTMQGACAIVGKSSLCVGDNACRKRTVCTALCNVYINVRGYIVHTTLRNLLLLSSHRHTVNVS